MNLKKQSFTVLAILTFIVAVLLSTTVFAVPLSYSPIPLTQDSDILTLNTSSDPDISLALENNLQSSDEAYSNLFNDFYSKLSNTERYQENVYTINGIAPGGFPDYYAGAYVNKDLNLVVLLAEDSIKTNSSLASVQKTISSVTDDSSLIYSSAKFSYNELAEIMNTIYQYKIKNNLNVNTLNAPFKIHYYAIDDYKNRVVVALDDISAPTIELFKTLICDSPAIDFIYSGTNTLDVEHTILNPGAATDTCSVGFHVYKYENNKYVEGFVTAAHCYDPGEPVTIDGSVVADAHTTAWQYGGNADAVFCVMRPGNSFRNTISYVGGTLKDGIDASLALGHPLVMVGQTTKGASGIITSSSAAYDSNNIEWYDLALANYHSRPGDSGGIVISTRSGNNYIAGINRGLHGVYAVFTKAVNITPNLNLTFNDGNNT